MDIIRCISYLCPQLIACNVLFYENILYLGTIDKIKVLI